MTVEEDVGLARSVDTIIAVNEIDAAPFRKSGHGDVMVHGHAVEPPFDDRPHVERSGFLFVGPAFGDDTPNTDAMVWFIDRVLPLVRTGLDPTSSCRMSAGRWRRHCTHARPTSTRAGRSTI